jgi:hypothetical protein
MKHLTEEQIVLHYYGEEPDEAAADSHLASCPQCRAEFEKIKALLEGIPVTPVPEPPDYLAQKVWFHVRDRMHEREPWSWSWKGFFSPAKFATAGAVAALMIAAFLAGHFWSRPTPPVPSPPTPQVNSRRVVLVAVGDHLERSQMLLIEIMNTDTKDRVDLSQEQERARSLLDNNRLYQISAPTSGDPAVAPVLDELERVLTEIANGSAQPSARHLREIRSNIESQDLLFKIRVVHSNVTREEDATSKYVNQRL